MFFANDPDGNRVFIAAAHQKVDYCCPICGNPMILKKGLEKRHHFAHKSGTTCSDTWSYEDSKQNEISDWHLSWQERFPVECREVVLSSNFEKHRADVFVEKSKTVVEFQKSALSPEEFDRRNNFFISLGYRVIWIFDEINEYENGQLSRKDSEKEVYHWIRPRRTLNNYSISNNVSLYLQLFAPDDDLEHILYRITWVAPRGIEYLALEPDGESIQDFLEHFTFPLKSSSGIPLETICDKMMPLYSEEMMTLYAGCPISEDHISADNHYESEILGIRGCSNCPNILNLQPVLCKKRIADLNLPQTAIVLNVSRNQKGYIDTIFYKNSASAGTAIKVSIPYSKPTGRSISDQWPSDSNVAIFVNVQTGWFLKVTVSQYRAYLKNQKLFGYLSKERYKYRNEPQEIFAPDKPIWKVVWCGERR